MHQFGRLPLLRCPSGPEAGIIVVLAKPHAPIQAAFRQGEAATLEEPHTP